MSGLHLNENVSLSLPDDSSPCTRYAGEELIRLLARCGIRASASCVTGRGCSIGIGTEDTMTAEDIRHDGFQIRISEHSAILAALEPKGLLNAVYEFAEMLGFAFLKPGPEGEWIPNPVRTPTVGLYRSNPRFPHRGLFLATSEAHTPEEHLCFLAKLKFNAVGGHGGRELDKAFYVKLGIRRESGGHGLPGCLDRKLFSAHPEYFRMFQPEDFGGRRMPDSNLCVTNPEARKIVARTFGERLKDFPDDLYALHAWADDLPGGGWCMCPSCRSYSPADQNMLGMKLLCRGAEAVGSSVRVPVIAYHDTLFPGEQIAPEKRMFLLWAPRERCYAHAIDDPACRRNRVHWEALKKWMEKFQGIDDAHTFEYYLDQLLFTGLFPFLPETIAGDMAAYEKAGIQSHMTLQVCSWDIMPDYNELFFARAHWDRSLTRASFIRRLSDAVAGSAAASYGKFLNAAADCFQSALIMCGHDPAMYLDYRWLPESDTPFARRAAEAYRVSSEKLRAAAEQFEKEIPSSASERFRALASDEIRRAVFESAELMSMHWQQSAMVCFGRAQQENDPDAARQGCECLEKNIETEKNAAALARKAGYAEEWHYLSARSPWAIREAEQKREKYSAFTKL